MDRVKEKLAMFKFSVIAPIVNGTYKGPATEPPRASSTFLEPASGGSCRRPSSRGWASIASTGWMGFTLGSEAMPGSSGG